MCSANSRHPTNLSSALRAIFPRIAIPVNNLSHQVVTRSVHARVKSSPVNNVIFPSPRSACLSDLHCYIFYPTASAAAYSFDKTPVASKSNRPIHSPANQHNSRLTSSSTPARFPLDQQISISPPLRYDKHHGHNQASSQSPPRHRCWCWSRRSCCRHCNSSLWAQCYHLRASPRTRRGKLTPSSPHW